MIVLITVTVNLSLSLSFSESQNKADAPSLQQRFYSLSVSSCFSGDHCFSPLLPSASYKVRRNNWIYTECQRRTGDFKSVSHRFCVLLFSLFLSQVEFEFCCWSKTIISLQEHKHTTWTRSLILMAFCRSDQHSFSVPIYIYILFCSI